MSPRTFLRRFRAETGQTPAAWIATQRVTAAQAMLESTGLSIEQIAHRAGLGSAESLRVHFRDQLHTTPSAYRRAFNPDPRLHEFETGKTVGGVIRRRLPAPGRWASGG